VQSARQPLSARSQARSRALAQSAIDDYGWFTPADLRKLFQVIHDIGADRVILVGGQSLTAWVQYFDIQLPAIDGRFLTADADFQGTKADAEAIANALGGKIQYARMDDHTPEVAVVEYQGAEGPILHIDFLTGILGVPPEDVAEFSLALALPGHAAINVIHPTLVLESRCSNLERLPQKRNGNGITQAKVGCQIVQRYLELQIADPERHRACHNNARRLLQLAQSKAGLYVWKNYGIDVLSPINPEQMPGEFLKSWPHDLARVERKREIANRQHAVAQGARGGRQEGE